jgi:hypothetical protein
VVHVEVGGIDFSVWKIWLKALQKPPIGDKTVYYSDINIALKCGMPYLVNEVKKVGVIIDRGLEM